MNKIRGFASVELFVILLWLAAVIGWIINVFRIIGGLNDPINGMFIFRIVGVFVAPLGAILGYIP
jgi:hypothetical protein